MNDSVSDHEIVKRILEGENEDYAILLKKYMKPLYKFIYSRVNDAEESQDLVHDTFVRARKNLTGFDPDAGSFKSWLYWQARGVRSNFFRKLKRITKLKQQAGSVVKMQRDIRERDDIDEERMNRILCVEKVMKGLEEKEGQLAVLLAEYRHGEISLREIAMIRNCSEKTVGRHLKKLIIKLQPLLQQCL